MNQPTLFSSPKFKKGDEVRFVNMVQPNYPPFEIEEVREVQGYYEYRIGSKWWLAGCLERWKKSMAKAYRW